MRWKRRYQRVSTGDFYLSRICGSAAQVRARANSEGAISYSLTNVTCIACRRFCDERQDVALVSLPLSSSQIRRSRVSASQFINSQALILKADHNTFDCRCNLSSKTSTLLYITSAGGILYYISMTLQQCINSPPT